MQQTNLRIQAELKKLEEILHVFRGAITAKSKRLVIISKGGICCGKKFKKNPCRESR